MTPPLQPWQVAFTWAVGWVNRRQQLVIEYLCAENRVLREQVPKKRILLTDGQRRRLAVKGKELGRKGLESITTLCHARYDPALASPAGGAEVGLLRTPEPSRPTSPRKSPS